MNRLHHAGRPHVGLPMRPDHSGSMGTTQPRRNRSDEPDDDHRHRDGTPPMLVESGKPVRALAARPEGAKRDKDGSHRESDATHAERIVGPMTSGRSRTRSSGAGDAGIIPERW